MMTPEQPESNASRAGCCGIILVLLLVLLFMGFMFRAHILGWLFEFCRGVCSNPHGARDTSAWLMDGLSR